MSQENNRELVLRIARQAGISEKDAVRVLYQEDLKSAIGFDDYELERSQASAWMETYVSDFLYDLYTHVVQGEFHRVSFANESFVAGEYLVESSDGGAEWRSFDLSEYPSSYPLEWKIDLHVWVRLTVFDHKLFEDLVNAKLARLRQEIDKFVLDVETSRDEVFESYIKVVEHYNGDTYVWTYLVNRIPVSYEHNATYEERLERATQELKELQNLIRNQANDEPLTVAFDHSFNDGFDDVSIRVIFGQEKAFSVRVEDFPYLYFYMFANFPHHEEGMQKVLEYLNFTGEEDDDQRELPLAWMYGLKEIDLQPLNAEHEQALRRQF